METSALAKQYVEQSLENVAIRNLYDMMDVTDINSKSYTLDVDEGIDTVAEKHVEFDKYMMEAAPFIDERNEDGGDIIVEEGDEPTVSSSPERFGELFAESVYDQFSDAAATGSYYEPSLDGIRRAFETYEKYTGRSPTRLVVDDDLLGEDDIESIEDLDGVTVFESEYLDLGDELLMTNNEFGYELVRSEVDARAWQDSDHAARMEEAPPISKEHPQVVSVMTRRAFAEMQSEHAMQFRTIRVGD